MAKKKLNKKLAILGSVAIGIIAIMAIFVILYKTQKPDKFIKDGDIAYAAKDYELALKKYGKALGFAKKNQAKIPILFKLALVNNANNDWQKELNCYRRVVTMDTSNVPARVKVLDFYYETADLGQGGAWKEVLTTAEELVKLQPKVAKYYRIKGRALVEMAKRGEAPDREQAIKDAITVLQKAKELDPKNGDTYWYLAQASIVRGDLLASKGISAEKDKGVQQGLAYLKQAIAIAPSDPNCYIYSLSIQARSLTEKGKQLDSLEGDYTALKKKFPNSAIVYAALSSYYRLDSAKVDKAIEAAKKASELDKTNVNYVLTMADLYNFKGALTNDPRMKQAAAELAQYGLKLPDAQIKPGPREWTAKMNRLGLNAFLANLYIGSAMDMDDKADKAKKAELITNAEKAVYEINQIIGSGDDPFVMQFDGLIDYVKGDTAAGIKKMYAAYQKLLQGDKENTNSQLGELSYALAKAYADTPELGSRYEFLLNAIQRGKSRTRPDIILDYAEVSISLTAYNNALSALDMYEKLVKPTTRSQLLRARTMIAAGQLDDADSLLSKIPAEDIEVLAAKFALTQKKVDQALVARSAEKDGEAINAEIGKILSAQAMIAEKLVAKDANAISAVTGLLERCIAVDQLDIAKNFINKALPLAPANATLLVYRQILAQKEPAKLGAQKRSEIMEGVVNALPDSKQKALLIAETYRSKQEYGKALIEFRKAFELDKKNAELASLFFETAIQAEDYKTAGQIVSAARAENLDKCQGQLYAARLAMSQKEYKDAVAKLDDLINERPIFSMAYLLRSNANAELGNEKQAIEDVRKASTMNPFDGMAAKQLARLLYQRDRKLGTSISEEQKTETRQSIERATMLNPREWQLLSFYAEYISDADPRRALSIRQKLQAEVPTVENAVLLGNMAVKMAATEKDKDAAKAYLDIAGASYEQGYKIAPNNNDLLFSYAQYLRTVGKVNEATALLSKSSDQDLLWKYYLNNGQVEKAKQMLEALYKKQPKNPLYLKGLLAISQQTGDSLGVQKYSKELLVVEDTKDNQVAQVQAMLDVGLIAQAQKQLAEFREKNPDDAAGLLLESYVNSRKGEYDKAVVLLNKCLSLNDSDVRAWRLRGLVYFMQGKYSESINDLSKAKNLAANTRIRMELAKAYFRAKRGDDAVNELILAVKEDENSFEARQMLESVYMQLGRKDALRQFYADLIKQFPDGAYWYNQAGVFELSQNEPAKAAEIFRQAWQITQKDDNAKNPGMIKLGQSSMDGYLNALLVNKQYDQLVAVAAKYVDSSFATIAYARMADAKSKVGDKQAALDLYKKALDKAGTDEGLLLEILGRMTNVVGSEQAVAWCAQQLKQSPDSAVLNYAMANLTKVAKEYNKSLEYIDNCIRIVGEKSPMYRNLVDQKQATLVMAFDKTKDKQYLKQAIGLYEDMIAKSSEVEIGALNNLAYLIANNSDNYDQAVQYARKAYEASPANPNILDTYAYTLLKKGDYTKAAEYVTISLQMFEQASVAAPSEVYEHLGMIKEKLGKKADAITAYKQSLDVGAQSLSEADKERIKKAIEKLK